MPAELVSLEKFKNKGKSFWIPVFQKLKKAEWVKVPYLKEHPKTGYIYVKAYKAGKGEFVRTTGFKKDRLKEALAKGEEIYQQWKNSNTLIKKRKRVDTVCDELLLSLEKLYQSLDQNGRRLRRKRTFEHDKTYIPILKRYFGEFFIDQIDTFFWDNWVEDVGRGEGRLLFDIGKYLSKLLTFAERKRYIHGKPTIKNPDKTSNSAIIYEDTDVIEFYNYSEPTLQDLIILNCENPLRPHEALELQWPFVHFMTDGKVILKLPEWFCKIDMGRELQISEQASQMLRRRYDARHPDSPFVFRAPKNPLNPLSRMQLSRMWRRMLVKVGCKQAVKFHWLRHTFYTKALLDAKVPIAQVSEAGGTSIVTLQERYLRSNAARTADVSKAVRLKLGIEVSK